MIKDKEVVFVAVLNALITEQRRKFNELFKECKLEESTIIGTKEFTYQQVLQLFTMEDVLLDTAKRFGITVEVE